MKTILYSITGEFSEPIPESGKDIVIAIDARLLSTHQVTLPKMSKAKANKAIPFALENQLLDDIDLLQFFPIKSLQANTWSVVVIATDIIHKIEQELQQAKCKPAAIVPDFLLLPFIKGKVSYIENEGMATFRSDLYQGGCLENSVFQELFKESSLVKSSQSFDPQSKINLHTNYFKKGDQGYFHAWRLPVTIALIALLLASVQMWTKNNQLETQINQQRTNNEQQFRDLFPQVKRIVNIRVQSKQELAAVLEKNKLYQHDLLGKLATEVFPNSRVSRIVLKNQKLTVEIIE